MSTNGSGTPAPRTTNIPFGICISVREKFVKRTWNGRLGATSMMKEDGRYASIRDVLRGLWSYYNVLCSSFCRLLATCRLRDQCETVGTTRGGHMRCDTKALTKEALDVWFNIAKVNPGFRTRLGIWGAAA